MSISASGRCRVRPADQAGPAGGAAARLACGLRQRLLWVCPKSEVLHVVARASSGALSRHSERRLCRRWTVWRMSPPRPSPMHPKSTAPNYAGTRGHLFRACRGFCRSLQGPGRLRTPLLVRVVAALWPGGAQRRSPKHRMHCRASCRQVGAYQLTCPCDVWAQRHVMCRSHTGLPGQPPLLSTPLPARQGRSDPSTMPCVQAWPYTGSSLAAAGMPAARPAACCAATIAACSCGTRSTAW